MSEPAPIEITEKDKLWAEFANECFKVGQIEYSIETAASHIADLEKQLEVRKRAVKSAAHKHDEHVKKLQQSPKAAEQPQKETSQEINH